jgi:RNA 2',3'-cyclic 3'-phosphodiesterase
MPRLFIALELPENIKAALASLGQGGIRVRWIPREQIHLTLAFIGELPTDQYRLLNKILDQVEFYPFEGRVGDLGFFGKESHPRVLWVALDGGEDLYKLQQEIIQQLKRHNIPFDAKNFKPHITLGRAREERSPKSSARELIQNFLQQGIYLDHSTFQINSFTLFSSKLTPDGSVYTSERVYPLNSNS